MKNRMKNIELFNSIEKVMGLINEAVKRDGELVDRWSVARSICNHAMCLAELHHRFTGEYTIATRGHIESTIRGMLENAMNMCGVPNHESILEGVR